MNLQSECGRGLQSSEGLTVAGDFTFKMVHSRGCWLEDNSSLLLERFHRALVTSHDGSWLPPE